MTRPLVRDLVRYSTACLPDLPESDRVRLARARALRRPALLALADDRSPVVRAALAGRRDLPGDVETALAADPAVQVRRALARRPGLTIALFPTLATDGDTEVRRLIAARPDVPLSVLRGLAYDSAAEVRCHVALAPHCPAALLDHLAQDPDPYVRAQVVGAPHLSWALLQALARDTDVGVLATLCVWAPELPPAAVLALAQNAHLSRCAEVDVDAVIERLDELVPYGAGSVTATAIRELLRHPHADVRAAGRRLAIRWRSGTTTGPGIPGALAMLLDLVGPCLLEPLFPDFQHAHQ